MQGMMVLEAVGFEVEVLLQAEKIFVLVLGTSIAKRSRRIMKTSSAPTTSSMFSILFWADPAPIQ
jgi:hypothetical protein